MELRRSTSHGSKGSRSAMSQVLSCMVLFAVLTVPAVEGIDAAAVSIGPISSGGSIVGINQHALLKVNIDIEFMGWQASDTSPDSVLLQEFQEGFQWIVSVDEVSLASQPLHAPSLTSQEHLSSQQPISVRSSSSLESLLEMEQILTLSWSPKQTTLHGSAAVSFLLPLEEDSRYPPTSGGTRTLVVGVWQETLSLNTQKRKRLLARRLAHVARTRASYERSQHLSIGERTVTAPEAPKHYAVVEISASSRYSNTSSSRLIQPVPRATDTDHVTFTISNAFALGALVAVSFHLLTRQLFGSVERKSDTVVVSVAVPPREIEPAVSSPLNDQEEDAETLETYNEDIGTDNQDIGADDRVEEVEPQSDHESDKAEDHEEDDDWWPGGADSIDDQGVRVVVENTQVLLSWSQQRNSQNSASSSGNQLDLPPPVERHVVRPMPTHGITFEAEIERFNSLNLLSPLGSRLTRSTVSSAGHKPGHREKLNIGPGHRVTPSLGSPQPLSWNRPNMFNSPGPVRRKYFAQIAANASNTQPPDSGHKVSRTFSFNGFRQISEGYGDGWGGQKPLVGGQSPGKRTDKVNHGERAIASSNLESSAQLDSTKDVTEKEGCKTKSSCSSTDTTGALEHRKLSSGWNYSVNTVTGDRNDSETLLFPEAGVVRSVSLEEGLKCPRVASNLNTNQMEGKRLDSASGCNPPQTSETLPESQTREETAHDVQKSSLSSVFHFSEDAADCHESDGHHPQRTSYKAGRESLPTEQLTPVGNTEESSEAQRDQPITVCEANDVGACLDRSDHLAPRSESFTCSESRNASNSMSPRNRLTEAILRPDVSIDETANSISETANTMSDVKMGGADSLPTKPKLEGFKQCIIDNQTSRRHTEQSSGDEETRDHACSSSTEDSRDDILNRYWLVSEQLPLKEMEPGKQQFQSRENLLEAEEGMHEMITPMNQAHRDDGLGKNVVTEDANPPLESEDFEPRKLYDSATAQMGGAASLPTKSVLEGLKQCNDTQSSCRYDEQSSGNEDSRDGILNKHWLVSEQLPLKEMEPGKQQFQSRENSLEAGEGMHEMITPMNQMHRDDGVGKNVETEDINPPLEAEDFEPRKLYDSTTARTRAARRGRKRPRVSLEVDEESESDLNLSDPWSSALSASGLTPTVAPSSSLLDPERNLRKVIIAQTRSLSARALEHVNHSCPIHVSGSDAGDSTRKTHSLSYVLTLSPNTFTSDERVLSLSEPAKTKNSNDCVAEPSARDLQFITNFNQPPNDVCGCGSRIQGREDDSIETVAPFPISKVLVRKRSRKNYEETEATKTTHSEVLPEVVPSLSLVTVAQNLLAPVWEFTDEQGNTMSKRKTRQTACNTIVLTRSSCDQSNKPTRKPVVFSRRVAEKTLVKGPFCKEEAGASDACPESIHSTCGMSDQKDSAPVPSDSSDEGKESVKESTTISLTCEGSHPYSKDSGNTAEHQ